MLTLRSRFVLLSLTGLSLAATCEPAYPCLGLLLPVLFICLPIRPCFDFTLIYLTCSGIFRTSPFGPQEAVLFLFRFLFWGAPPPGPYTCTQGGHDIQTCFLSSRTGC